MPDLSRWTVRTFESRDGEGLCIYFSQSDKSTWGPFNSETEAWAWARCCVGLGNRYDHPNAHSGDVRRRQGPQGLHEAVHGRMGAVPA